MEKARTSDSNKDVDQQAGAVTTEKVEMDEDDETASSG